MAVNGSRSYYNIWYNMILKCTWCWVNLDWLNLTGVCGSLSGTGTGRIDSNPDWYQTEIRTPELEIGGGTPKIILNRALNMKKNQLITFEWLWSIWNQLKTVQMLMDDSLECHFQNPIDPILNDAFQIFLKTIIYKSFKPKWSGQYTHSRNRWSAFKSIQIIHLPKIQTGS